MKNIDEIKKITVWGLTLNIIIAIIKLIIGLLGNSQSVVADAAHSSYSLFRAKNSF
jgi:divalent metal cation (Fe/Co/Zn/Cd) transporter